MYIKVVKHVQETPSSKWIINVDSGIDLLQPLSIYNSEEKDIEPNDWTYENGVLTIDFGFDEMVGTVTAGYLADEPLPLDTMKNVIYDNKNRVNNLENTVNNLPHFIGIDSEKFVIELEKTAIEKSFIDAYDVEVLSNRKITIWHIMEFVKITEDGFKEYDKINDLIEVKVFYNEQTKESKLKIKSNRPITGYALVL